MESIRNKIRDVLNKAKGWFEIPTVKKYTRIAVFALTVFLWSYMIMGSAVISLIYFCGSAVLILKDLLKDKKRWVYKSAFVCVTALYGFIVSCFASIYVACLSVGLWLVIYLAFQKANRIREWIVGSIIPLAVILYAEFLQNNVRVAVKAIFSYESKNRLGFALSLILVAIICTLFVKIFNSKRIGYYISIGVFAILSNANFFVYTITEQPFEFSDIKTARTAAGVLGSQTLSFSDWVRFIAGIVFLAGIYLVVTFIYRKREEKKKLSKRILPVAGLCVSLLVMSYVGNYLYNSLLLYSGNVKYGFIGNFYITMNAKINMPENVKDYVIEDENEEGDHKPNVIIIMNEAFSDLGTTFNVDISEDPLDYFHSLQEAYPSGVTYSSVRGNNTCSSEWEVLSSSPTALTAKGSMIYQNNNKPMRSLVSLFDSRGYTTVGLHPYHGYGYNRANIYKSLGFDQTVFLEDMPDDLDTIRKFVTDEENYKQLIELYEENEAVGDNPFFCFNITMQNHGGYAVSQLDDVRVKGDKTYSDVDTYLSVLNHSDDALKTLISYFESVEEDTVILLFGDHQPLIDKVFYEDIYGKAYADLTLEELKEVYAVPYLIWANYDLNEEAAPEETSNCYLPSILFEVGGIPKSTWINMVEEYREEYPIISSVFIKKNDGEIYETDAALKNELSTDIILELYQMYSYGILYGIN